MVGVDIDYRCGCRWPGQHIGPGDFACRGCGGQGNALACTREMRGNVRHYWTCCGIHHNGCGCRMLHNILRFCTAEGTVNWHQNGTNLHQSKPGIEKFRAVGHHHTHAVASADTQTEESTGYPIDRGVKAGIRRIAAKLIYYVFDIVCHIARGYKAISPHSRRTWY